MHEEVSDMRRTFLATVAAAALLAATASAALAGPPAHGESKYGLGVIVHCGAPFGTLVAASKDVEGHRPVKGGAKAFITFMAANPEIAAAHGCFFGSD
jgi:hypothetical protein